MNTQRDLKPELQNMVVTLTIGGNTCWYMNGQSDNNVLFFLIEVVLRAHTGQKGYLPRFNPVKSGLIWVNLGFCLEIRVSAQFLPRESEIQKRKMKFKTWLSLWPLAHWVEYAFSCSLMGGECQNGNV